MCFWRSSQGWNWKDLQVKEVNPEIYGTIPNHWTSRRSFVQVGVATFSLWSLWCVPRIANSEVCSWIIPPYPTKYSLSGNGSLFPTSTKSDCGLCKQVTTEQGNTPCKSSLGGFASGKSYLGARVQSEEVVPSFVMVSFKFEDEFNNKGERI